MYARTRSFEMLFCTKTSHIQLYLFTPTHSHSHSQFQSQSQSQQPTQPANPPIHSTKTQTFYFSPIFSLVFSTLLSPFSFAYQVCPPPTASRSPLTTLGPLRPSPLKRYRNSGILNLRSCFGFKFTVGGHIFILFCQSASSISICFHLYPPIFNYIHIHPNLLLFSPQNFLLLPCVP